MYETFNTVTNLNYEKIYKHLFSGLILVILAFSHPQPWINLRSRTTNSAQQNSMTNQSSVPSLLLVEILLVQ